MFHLKEYLNNEFIGSTIYLNTEDWRTAVSKIMLTQQVITIKVIKFAFDEKGYPVEQLVFSCSFFEVVYE